MTKDKIKTIKEAAVSTRKNLRKQKKSGRLTISVRIDNFIQYCTDTIQLCDAAVSKEKQDGTKKRN